MEVILSEPASWYLLRAGEHHYFDVNCTEPLVSFSILLKFDDDEEAEYHALGRTFLQYFAAKVNYWSSRYWSRNITGALAEDAHQAAMSWQRAHEAGPPGAGERASEQPG